MNFACFNRHHRIWMEGIDNHRKRHKGHRDRRYFYQNRMQDEDSVFRHLKKNEIRSWLDNTSWIGNGHQQRVKLTTN